MKKQENKISVHDLCSKLCDAIDQYQPDHNVKRTVGMYMAMNEVLTKAIEEHLMLLNPKQVKESRK